MGTVRVTVRVDRRRVVKRRLAGEQGEEGGTSTVSIQSLSLSLVSRIYQEAITV